VAQDAVQEMRCPGMLLAVDIAGTLIDVQRFAGTCCRSANWMLLGQTQGRGRMDPRPLSQPATVSDPLENGKQMQNL